MNEKLSKICLKIIEEALDKKHAKLIFSVADGKVVNVELTRQKIKMNELEEAQKD